MLDPYDRRHLLEILKPPEGYTFDFAIGTTFSLDLLALMTAPIGFTFFEPEYESGISDPITLLESLRRYAGRISIFCHGGRIHVPRVYGLPLCTYIEGSVFQALPPKEGAIFHPKVWALRYTSPNTPVAYRFLCLSRNLTYDRSWDTALVLDGSLVDRENAFALNHPIGDFIASLPGMVEEELPEPLQDKIDKMQYEIRRVDFDLPQGFDEIVFHALGIGGRKANPLSGRIDRMLIVSPFLSEGCLNNLAALGKGSILVSRLESLKKIPPGYLQNFSDIFCLREGLVPEEDRPDVFNPEQTPMDVEAEHAFEEDSLEGLHAKLYVADAGGEGRIWTGSANATDAAFGKNVEFLVELRGRKNDCGIDTVLNGGKEAKDGKEAGLMTILDHPYSITYEADGGEDSELLNYLADKFQETREALVRAHLLANVIPGIKNNFNIILKGKIITSLSKDVSIMCRPITLPKGRAVLISANTSVYAEFKDLSDLDISAFFAFDVAVRSGDRRLKEGFVLKISLEGAPLDRNERILRAMLKDKSQVLRLMLLLLSLSSPTGNLAEEISDLEQLLSDRFGENRTKRHNIGSPPYLVPLFESMVRAMTRDPRSLDDLKSLIDDLRGHPETKDLLPEGIDEIWGPIWEARVRMGGDDGEAA